MAESQPVWIVGDRNLRTMLLARKLVQQGWRHESVRLVAIEATWVFHWCNCFIVAFRSAKVRLVNTLLRSKRRRSLSTEIVKCDIALWYPKVIEHLKDCRVHHGRSA